MRILAAVVAFLLFASSATPVHAAWPNSPFTNLPLCTAADNQETPRIIPDGTGGAIVTWQDFRSGTNYDIFAQHVLASGAVDPAWPADGRALCTAANDQNLPMIVPDDSGGAIVTWQDGRSGTNWDIYAQHVLASGAVDPAWPADGRALCTAANYQIYPMIAPDGSGGAIVTWQDIRNGGFYNIYVQHVLASGAVDPAWPADGRALITMANNQTDPMIVPDGSGGVIVTWEDYRSGTVSDIYAQHLLASGAVDPAWPTGGNALCTAAGDQNSPMIVPDGAGGAIVTWYDLRSGTNFDIYAQHVLASGAVDGAWPTDGRALCTAANDQFYQQIVADGAGGAIVTWQDYRSGTNFAIYAQHVLASGAVEPAWPADGRALCTAANNQYSPTIVADGAGGAIVTWVDYRSGNYDIYAQHVLTSGAVDGAWPTDGRGLCTAANTQNYPIIAPDGSGGAIVAWTDYRSGTGSDIYAQRVEGFGRLGNPEPTIASLRDVPYDNGGRLKLSWAASYLDAAPFNGIYQYEVWRSIPPGAAQARLRGGARLLRPDALAPLARDGALLATANGTQTIYWEYVATQPARRFAGYSYELPTTGDSVAAGIPVTQALVLALASDGYSFWTSQPMSGYSVDNLAPAAPAPFTGEYAAGSATLHWGRNAEADLAGYRLYRGTVPGFVPGPANLVSALADTGYTDVAGQPYIYKLTAVDVHGNESPVATLSPSGTLAVDGSGAATLAFAPPSPNPANARTVLRYTLPGAGAVKLAIYDAAGRQVRVLAAGVREAGEHAEAWDLRDEGGRAVRAGLYFARFEAAGVARVRRVAVAR
ncbi:MAG: T9SS type A sorting domain-containing protein [Candidatus Eisenbacteria bacterium]|nr:T9SS type A sorting domain-containing protein [Candidatus Eisenbacteria bacterium]